MSSLGRLWLNACWRLGPEIAGLGPAKSRNGVAVSGSLPLAFETPAGQWHYAVAVAVPAAARAEAAVAVVARVEVLHGAVGVGALCDDDRSFLVECPAGPGMHQIEFLVEAPERFAWVMFRNITPDGIASKVVVHGLELRMVAPARSPYPTSLPNRDWSAEPEPVEEGISVFQDEQTRTINHARLAHLSGLGLPLAGRSVLDAGCGLGFFADYYLGQGCDYTALDGRAANIDAVLHRLPHIRTGVADLERDRLTMFGHFDVVHCYGLLYHLESPIAALRNLAEICSEIMVVETMVCDSAQPVMLLVDESRSYNQALHGLGSRPSPTFMALALNRVGFPHVYGTVTQPDHPDFNFDFGDTLERRLDGHDLRRVFVASRRPLDLPELVPLVVSRR